MQFSLYKDRVEPSGDGASLKYSSICTGIDEYCPFKWIRGWNLPL